MTDKEKDKKTKKVYPKDNVLTEQNALIEIAKDIREIRNLTGTEDIYFG